jgi:alkylated DNA nucleotide flippase Atl1
MSAASITDRIDALSWDRVVRADGYRWGQARKAELLKREGAR